MGVSGARAVCLPASIGLAATFDTALVAEVGQLLGRESVRKGSSVLLAPTINMARYPLGGRNFESFGEDPLLTSAIAVAYVIGVQEEGVGACAKHFVANDVEFARLTVSSNVDEQTLREVYLTPFEAVVDAGVWSLMAAYPKLNGEHCTENRWLLTDVLRSEWGFDGLVMSDWGATHHPTRSIEAGLDLEMPGPAVALGDRLLQALRNNEISEDAVNASAANVAALSLRPERRGSAHDVEQSVDDPDERQLCRRAAADGMVLVANRPHGEGGPTLPLSTDLKTVAVIGPNADPGVIQGGGSAQLPAHHHVSPVEGLRQAMAGVEIAYAKGCNADRYVPLVSADKWKSLEVVVYPTGDLSGEPTIRRTARSVGAFFQGPRDVGPDPYVWSQRWTGLLEVSATGSHRFGVLGVGPCRVVVNGQVVADNWTNPQPGQGFFEKASQEVVGETHLETGSMAEVIVEWSRGDDEQLAGLRFGYQAPVDEGTMFEEAVALAVEADAAVVVVGLTAEWETESHDRSSFALPGRQDELVRRVAAVNDRTVVVVNAGGPIAMPWIDDVGAALLAWYPGQEFGHALADVVLGLAEPGGRLPVSFPVALEDAPSAAYLPAPGSTSEGDRTAIEYGERLHIGHRGYKVAPRLPFGFGLSYTDFEIGSCELVETERIETASPILHGRHLVQVTVVNTGNRQGKCVVQAYMKPGDNPDGVDRPRVLAGFSSQVIAAGQSAQVAVTIPDRVLEFWDAKNAAEPSGGWSPLVGAHQLEIGWSSSHVAHSLPLIIN